MINFTKEECEKIISLSNVLEKNIQIEILYDSNS